MAEKLPEIKWGKIRSWDNTRETETQFGILTKFTEEEKEELINVLNAHEGMVEALKKIKNTSLTDFGEANEFGPDHRIEAAFVTIKELAQQALGETVNRIIAKSDDRWRDKLKAEQQEKERMRQGWVEAKVRIEQLKNENKRKYRAGYEAGLRAYAWWKDGVQYVGTCGTTLDEALGEIDD